jgi:hypothetical protein
MDFVRQIVEPGKLAGIIEIPEKLRKSRLEVIILPVENSKKEVVRKPKKQHRKFRELYENPIKVEKINFFSREELHER